MTTTVPPESSRATTRQLLFYFGLLSLLVNLVAPQYLLDIPTSYMLKNVLNASASQISMFRLLIGIPIYLGFVFGMVRDQWSPFGWRDRGYFRIFVPVLMLVLVWMAFSKTTYAGLVVGMLLATIVYSFMSAAYQGLIALIGQEALMPGRLSSLWYVFLFFPMVVAYFAAGYMTEHLTPKEIFLLAMALTAVVGAFGIWKPKAVFSHAYDNPHARGTDFLGDVKRLVKHKAIYPVVLINLLWNFTPGANTPMQFYLSNQLHAPDAIYADFQGILYMSFLPVMVLYGFLCTKFPPRKLLWWSVILGIPQFIPMAFIHSGSQALVMAVLIGLAGGMANVATVDIAMRACPPGLQGTLMMLVVAIIQLSFRGGDVVGSWLYGLNPKYGFQYCVAAITVVYILILPVIPFLPKELMSTADGEPNPEAQAAVLAEIGESAAPA
jgi:MFS family permease